ncbi:hypothetical protein D5R40_20615 [Okeania hirsuta]|uniref:Uncharacterized protein n=1 Tax=Okeania hirsuta TaxID=1458930 RepID=A0A3N6P7B0_9CYAN|nr:hypothetical protein D4Z78_16775 [Okeania hirsuta]RQH34513.1 hypothetical protein D5R40_20615 [Okeania hirsuta]
MLDLTFNWWEDNIELLDDSWKLSSSIETLEKNRLKIISKPYTAIFLPLIKRFFDIFRFS